MASDDGSTARTIRPGDVLAGKYRVERLLGVGGMGVVVAAEHIDLHERVALKFMQRDALDNAEAVERFLREARAAVKIKSEHVARVTDVGRLEGGEPYIVMEYLKGDDLNAILAARGTLPIDEAIECLLQACEAVAEAHTLGIVHRDLKPSNLFLTQRPDGTPSLKVLDFGISKMTPLAPTPDDGAMSMTRTKQPLGTPLYMPPEQMASARSADARSDIWSLGVILFELVTGVPPFNGGTFHELRRKIAQDPVPSVRAVQPAAPLALDRIVKRCLEKDPAKRYQNIADFAVDLAGLGQKRARESAQRIARMIEKAGLASTALTPTLPLDEAADIRGFAETLQGPTPEHPRWKLPAAVAGLLLLTAGAVAVITRERGAPDTSPAGAGAPPISSSHPAQLDVPSAAPAPAPSAAVTASAELDAGAPAPSASSSVAINPTRKPTTSVKAPAIVGSITSAVASASPVTLPVLRTTR